MDQSNFSQIHSQTPDTTPEPDGIKYMDNNGYHYSSETESVTDKQGFIKSTVKNLFRKNSKNEESTQQHPTISENKLTRMKSYLLPFTYQTFLVTSSISIILASYGLPSFTHGYKHITTQPMSFFLIYITIMAFFLMLTLTTAWVMKSFKLYYMDSTMEPNLYKLQQDKRKINLTISLMVVFGILVTVISCILLFALFIGFPSSSVDARPESLESRKSETKSESLEASLRLIIKQAYAEDIAMVLTLGQAIMKRLDLPKVEVKPEYVLKNVLQPHAFFQASAFVRIFYFLLIYFTALANYNLWATVYWLFHFRGHILNWIEDIEENGDSQEEQAAMIPISAYGTPMNGTHLNGTFSGTPNIMSPRNYAASQITIRSGSRPVSRFGGYNMNQNNNLNRQVKLVKSIDVNYDEVPEESISHTTGIIEVPFIGKSTDNLNHRFCSPLVSRQDLAR